MVSRFSVFGVKSVEVKSARARAEGRVVQGKHVEYCWGVRSLGPKSWVSGRVLNSLPKILTFISLPLDGGGLRADFDPFRRPLTAPKAFTVNRSTLDCCWLRGPRGCVAMGSLV